MYILQISDLHISKESDHVRLKNKILRLVDAVKGKVPKDSQLVCCVLGDIVDCGFSDGYALATELLRTLQTGLYEFFGVENVALEIVPGNHDIHDATLDYFNQFATKILGKSVSYTNQSPVFVSQHYGYTFISISSVLDGEMRYGQVDFEKLTRVKIEPDSIFLIHHALVSGDNGDSAVIRNGYKMQGILEECDAVALLHGHTHGCKRYSVGHNCQVIGVGPMFKEETDISNQCNIVDIKGGKVVSIVTLIYQGDRDIWIADLTYKQAPDNNYYGTSAKLVYDRVLKNATENTLLPNLRIQIQQDYADFCEEMRIYFKAYLDDAELWQRKSPSQKLSYTHGQLMDYKGEMWEKFISETLIKNPTSKRAILPLIEKPMTYAGGDDKLVSFDFVQFGFTNDEWSDLQITVYFRALEVCKFLPINLCELYLMAEKIRERIKSIQKITICLFAFRAEANPQYGCYKKADIELYDKDELCALFKEADFYKLRCLLYQKAKLVASVVEVAWFNNLKQAIQQEYIKYNRETVLQQTKSVEIALFAYKEARLKCSTYSETRAEEKKFVTALEQLGDMIVEE